MEKGRDIGMIAEEKTRQALELLAREWEEISMFIHASRNGEIDALHIDFLILLKSGVALGLQVKSNERSAKKHSKKYPFIPVIVIERRDIASEIALRIKKLVLESYQRVKETPLSN